MQTTKQKSGRKAAKGKGRAAISAQQSIPYISMHPDGVCKLPGGLYTKTVEYEDINYSVASTEDQTAIFSGWSSLAVCCVTVAFCSNMLMVQDKVSGARRDLTVAPVRRSVLALGYYIATAVSTLIIFLITACAGFLYLAKVGWYLSATDILLIFADVFLLVLFGTALSSIINVFLTTQGQISAVGTIVSAGYGFLCGAYMPISNFSDGLQKVLSFLPGTYGTSLLRNHAMRGVFAEMAESGFPKEVIEGIRDSLDCNLYFFDSAVETSTMYCILGGAAVAVIAVYVLICRWKRT